MSIGYPRVSIVVTLFGYPSGVWWYHINWRCWSVVSWWRHVPVPRDFVVVRGAVIGRKVTTEPEVNAEVEMNPGVSLLRWK